MRGRRSEVNLTECLLKEKIVAIVRGVSADHAVSVGRALYEAGIRFVEVTMNSERAPESIAKMREHYPELYIGAGTVTNSRLAEEAAAAGAQYFISPNVDTTVIAYGLERGLHVWPGAMTPSEIVLAWESGAQAVKLFPAGSLGTGYLEAIRAPLNHIPLIATGGIHLDNAAAYLKSGACAVGLGGQLINLNWIRDGQFHLLTEMGRRYVSLLKGD